MIDARIAWFWQPPIDGQPGLLMVVDMHPGPDHPEIPQAIETLPEVLVECESQMPPEIELHTLRIYVRDVAGFWMEVEMNALNRRFKSKIPALPDKQLTDLWFTRLPPDKRIIN